MPLLALTTCGRLPEDTTKEMRMPGKTIQDKPEQSKPEELLTIEVVDDGNDDDGKQKVFVFIQSLKCMTRTLMI